MRILTSTDSCHQTWVNSISIFRHSRILSRILRALNQMLDWVPFKISLTDQVDTKSTTRTRTRKPLISILMLRYSRLATVMRTMINKHKSQARRILNLQPSSGLPSFFNRESPLSIQSRPVATAFSSTPFRFFLSHLNSPYLAHRTSVHSLRQSERKLTAPYSTSQPNHFLTPFIQKSPFAHPFRKSAH